MLLSNRKSQLYIITALFLCSMFFLISARSDRLKESTIDFGKIYHNFDSEARYAINSMIYQNKNISSEFGSFAGDYIKFAESEGIVMKLFYGITYEDDVYLNNMIGGPVNITTDTINFILTQDNQSVITKRDWMTAEIDGTKHMLNTSRNVTELKFVMKMYNENKTEVRVNG